MPLGYPNSACTTCPTDCSTPTLPAVSSSDCTQAWDKRESEGYKVYLAPYDGTFTEPITHANMTDLATWTGLIDNATGTAPFIRELYVIGDLPIPEKNTFEYKGQQIVTNKTFTYSFDVIDVNDTNYAMSRDLDCGGTYWFAWETDGGSLFGWALATITSDVEQTRGSGSLETLKFTATWKATCKPPRYTSPFAG